MKACISQLSNKFVFCLSCTVSFHKHNSSTLGRYEPSSPINRRTPQPIRLYHFVEVQTCKELRIVPQSLAKTNLTISYGKKRIFRLNWSQKRVDKVRVVIARVQRVLHVLAAEYLVCLVQDLDQVRIGAVGVVQKKIILHDVNLKIM